MGTGGLFKRPGSGLALAFKRFFNGSGQVQSTSAPPPPPCGLAPYP